MNAIGISEIVTGIVSGVMVSGCLFFVLKTQNKKIDGQDKKIDDLDDKKTDKSLCKTIHVNLDKSDTENKEIIKDIQIHLTEQLVATTEIKACLNSIKRAIEKQGG